MIGDMLGALVLTMAAATQIGVDAQHGGRDATSARCVLPRLPRHTLVDRAASAEGMAVAIRRASAGRGGPQGRGGVAVTPADRGGADRPARLRAAGGE